MPLQNHMASNHSPAPIARLEPPDPCQPWVVQVPSAAIVVILLLLIFTTGSLLGIMGKWPDDLPTIPHPFVAVTHRLSPWPLSRDRRSDCHLHLPPDLNGQGFHVLQHVVQVAAQARQVQHQGTNAQRLIAPDVGGDLICIAHKGTAPPGGR
jgi:hypothetical protein